MGAKLFGLDIAKLVKQSAAAGMLKVTFTKVTPGTTNPALPNNGTNPTTQVYAGVRGIVVEYKETTGDDGVRCIAATIMLLGDTLPSGVAPAPNDKILIAGYPRLAGKTCVIVSEGVTSDPAQAQWTCKVKA